MIIDLDEDEMNKGGGSSATWSNYRRGSTYGLGYQSNAGLESLATDIDKAVEAEKPKTNLLEKLEKVPQIPVNLAFAALQNTSNFGRDALIWATEKTAHGLGRLTNSERLKNFSPYTYYKEHPDELKNYQFDAAQASGWLYGDDHYKQNEWLYDLGGDVVATGMIGGGAVKLVSKGSKLYNMALKSGVPAKWVQNVFYNGERVAEATNKVKQAVTATSHYGINASSLKSVALASGQAARAIIPEAFKETIAWNVGVYASGYKRDEMFNFSERSLGSNLTIYGGVPIALGVALPLAGEWRHMKAALNRGAIKSARAVDEAVSSYMAANGYVAKPGGQYSTILNGYGLAGNSAADVAIANTYLIKGAEKMAETNMAKATERVSRMRGTGKELPLDLNELNEGYSKIIRGYEVQQIKALENLVVEGAENVMNISPVHNMSAALRRSSNALQGGVSARVAGDTQQVLDRQIGKQQILNRDKKLTKEAKTGKRSLHDLRENLGKDTNGLTHYLIDEEGQMFPAIDTHIRLTDKKGWTSANIKQRDRKISLDSKNKEQVYSVDFSDDVFNPFDPKLGYGETDLSRVSVSANPSGEVFTAYGGQQYAPIRPTHTAAFDPAWALLGKQRESLLKLHTVKGKTMPGYEAALLNNPKGWNVNLDSANHMQMRYLADVYSDINHIEGDYFNRLFHFDDKQIARELPNAAKFFNKPQAETDVRDVLEYLYYNKAKDIMQARLATTGANDQRFWQRATFSEEALMEEITGMRLRNASLTEPGYATGSVLDFIDARTFADVDEIASHVPQMNRSPKQYTLFSTSDAAQLTDEINENLMIRLAQEKEHRISVLSGQFDKSVAESMGNTHEPTFVNNLVSDIIQSPHYANDWLSAVDALGYNTDIFGQAGKYVLNQTVRTEGNLVLNAAYDFANNTSVKSQAMINKEFAGLHSVVRDNKLLANDEAMKQIGKFYHQTTSGWVMEEAEPVLLSNGKYGFRLDKNSTRNHNVAARQARLAQQEPRPLGDLLPDPITGEPLMVDELAKDFIVECDNVARRIYEGNTQINSALGREAGKRRAYYMPPKDLSKLEVRIIGYTDESKNFIPELFVTGTTAEQAEKAARLEMRLAGFDKKPQYKMLTTKEVGLEKEIVNHMIDSDIFQWADYSDAWRQQLSKNHSVSGVRTTKGSLIEFGEQNVKDIVYGYNHQFQLQAKRARSALFRDEINHAKAKLASKQSTDLGYEELNQYIAQLRGGSYMPSGKADEWVNKLYKGFDDFVEAGTDTFCNLMSSNEFQRKAANIDLREGFRYSSNMFKNTDEVMLAAGAKADIPTAIEEGARMIRLKKPGTAKELVANINKVATWSLLKLGNFGYAALNIASLPVMMPMMRMAMARRLGENGLEQSARLGAYVRQVGNGANFSVDIQGGFLEAVHHFMKNVPKMRNLVNEAYEVGYLSNNASMLSEMFFNPVETATSRGFKTFLKGISALGDKTEELSKIVPYLSGYRMAEVSGITSHHARMAFAKRYMDSVVGCYVANNKPLLLQHSLGSLNGLFYTYNHNVMQQVFTLMSGGDKAALATGAAMQTMMYGVSSVPGFEIVDDFLFPIGQGDDMYTWLRRKGMSDTATRNWLYGPLSNYTGLDFSGKGTINATGVPGFRLPPIYGLIGDTVGAVYEGVKSYASNTKTDPNMIWEILEARFPSTTIKSAISAGLGYRVDRNHNLISSPETVGKGVYYAGAAASIRPLDETLSRGVLFRKNGFDRFQQAKMNEIRQNFTAAIRRDAGIGEATLAAVNDYIAAGGNPKNIQQFVTNCLVKARLTPAFQAAVSATKAKHQTEDQAKLAEALRMIAIFSGGPTTSAVGQYGEEFDASDFDNR